MLIWFYNPFEKCLAPSQTGEIHGRTFKAPKRLAQMRIHNRAVKYWIDTEMQYLDMILNCKGIETNSGGPH